MKTRHNKERIRARGKVRSYILMLCSNVGKAEATRYAIWWSQRWCLDYVRQLYVAKSDAIVSTVGNGSLNNSALKTARDILRAGRAAEKATGVRFECPNKAPAFAIARIRAARRSRHFGLWVTIPKCPPIPVQPHKAFSRALRAGGKVTTQCQVRMGKHGGLVARVCVEFPRKEPIPSRDYLGCDVGVNAGAARSDGYVGKSLRSVMQRTKEKCAEQQRQGHRRSSARSAVKQALDREAQRVVTLAARTGKTLVIERLKMLGNLKPRGFIGGWARRHFGERVRQIAEITGVAVSEVNPAYTSVMHWRCGQLGRRRGVEFTCDQCGSREHADINAARNLVRKARGVFVYPTRHKGRVTNMVVTAAVTPSLVGVSS